MGTLSTCSGVSNKGEPFVQIIHNKVALTQVPPAAAVEFALGIITTASEAVVDAAAFKMVTGAGRSIPDAFDLIKSLRAARGQFVATAPVAEPAAPTSPIQAVQSIPAPVLPQSDPSPAAIITPKSEDAAAPIIKFEDLRLLLRSPLMEDISADTDQIRVAFYDVLRASVINIGDEYIIINRSKNFVRDGRFFITVGQRGCNNTEAVAHKRGSEIVCYHTAEEHLANL